LSSRPVRPRGTYTEWFWPPAPGGRGFDAFEHVLTPETDPGPRSSYFWAHQFQLENGEGGYLGLQTRGDRGDGTWEKIAIFSIWEALEADGPAPFCFTGEGVGWSCHIPYPWVAGRAYRLRVATDGAGWWVASAADDLTGHVSPIGRIKVPDACGGLGRWSVMWTEYYGPSVSRCSDLPCARVVFGTPTATSTSTSTSAAASTTAASTTVVPERDHSHLGDLAGAHLDHRTCDTSRVEAVPGGVRHEMAGAEGGA